MSDSKSSTGKVRQRIPLPPVLLTTVPLITTPLAVVLALTVFPATKLVIFLAALVGLIGPLIWLASRTRG